MGCWHGHGHRGCYDWPSPRGWYGPGYEDLDDEPDWVPRRRSRVRSTVDEAGTAQADARLDEMGEQLRRLEAVIAELAKSRSG